MSDKTVLNTDDDLFNLDDDDDIDFDIDDEDTDEDYSVDLDIDEEDEEDTSIELDEEEEDTYIESDEEEDTSIELGEEEDNREESINQINNTLIEDDNKSLETDQTDMNISIDLDSILDNLENDLDSIEASSSEVENRMDTNSQDDNSGSWDIEEDNKENIDNLVSEEDADDVYEDENGQMFTRNGNRPIGYDDSYNLVYLDVNSSAVENINDTEENNSDTEDDSTDDVLADIDNDSFNESVDSDPDDMDEDLDDSIIEPENNDFIDENGNLVVMNGGDVGETFEIKVISYKNIAIAKRIRSGKSVEDLVQSVKSTGLLNPIMVAPLATKDMYVLIDGYRRILACAKAGLTDIPAIVNNKIKTTEIPIVEAMYNHKKAYTMQDTIDYIEYLEKEKGITNPSLIEFLMDFDNGDYSKLKDILADDDEDIVSKLVAGQMTIAQAFKALEKRRSKESKEEKDIKKAAKVYGDVEESGASEIADTGETGDEESALTDEQLDELSINPTELDEGLDEQSLDSMVQESNDTPGFEAHQQKVGEREYIDPAIKKAVLARDNFTCACCKRGGESYVDSLDYHHMLPVFLGGKDTPENGVTLCVLCHRLVHLFSTGDLHLPKEKTEEEIGEMIDEERIIYEDEQRKFKRVVKLGDVIRKGIAQQGMNREQFKKDHSNAHIGRRKPGKNAVQEEA